MLYTIFEVIPGENGKETSVGIENVHNLAVAKEVLAECRAFSPDRYFGLQKNLTHECRIVSKAKSFNHGYLEGFYS